jgi:hypothetical protein
VTKFINIIRDIKNLDKHTPLHNLQIHPNIKFCNIRIKKNCSYNVKKYFVFIDIQLQNILSYFYLKNCQRNIYINSFTQRNKVFSMVINICIVFSFLIILHFYQYLYV